MNRYKLSGYGKQWPKFLGVALLLALILGFSSVVAVRSIYNENLKAVNANQKQVSVTVPLGATVKEIAALLKQHGLIRSEWAFQQYVRNQDLQDKLKGGTYSLRSSQTVTEIVEVLTQGKIQTDTFTIIPGQRIDEVRASLINSGFIEAEVDRALQPALYLGHPALVDLPSAVTSLEGYLYPETLQRTAETKPEELIQKFLDEMQKRLTPEIRNGIVRQGLTIHQGIIMASIIENEVSGLNAEDRPRVAQVFLKRLRIGMRLESDATTSYGAVLNGQTPVPGYDSPYNTYLYKSLPPGPISNVSASSLAAVSNPASTDWLYFVSGDDGVTYFSNTLSEHQSLTSQYCKKLCD